MKYVDELVPFTQGDYDAVLSRIDREYIAWIRSLPCCVCRRPGPSCAHHHTGSRGMSQKSNDRKTMPVCHGCHMAFHSASGWARDLNKAERREWQDRMVSHYQHRWTQLSCSGFGPATESGSGRTSSG